MRSLILSPHRLFLPPKLFWVFQYLYFLIHLLYVYTIVVEVIRQLSLSLASPSLFWGFPQNGGFCSQIEFNNRQHIVVKKLNLYTNFELLHGCIAYTWCVKIGMLVQAKGSKVCSIFSDGEKAWIALGSRLLIL